jgi:hypothetical protein
MNGPSFLVLFKMLGSMLLLIPLTVQNSDPQTHDFWK